MTDTVENLVLEHLRLLRNEIRDFREEARHEFQLIKLRLSSLENQLSTVHVDLAGSNPASIGWTSGWTAWSAAPN